MSRTTAHMSTALKDPELRPSRCPETRMMPTRLVCLLGVAGVLLEPGYEAEYEGRPPVYPIGSAGIIAEVDELPDGGYNILLRGLTKFRITGEDQSRPYRLAHVEAIPEELTDAERVTLGDLREELSALLPSGLPGLQVPAGLRDEDLVNGIAQIIQIDPLDRLGLLEQPGPLARAQALIDLLYIRSALQR